jgi:hypothetical protein
VINYNAFKVPTSGPRFDSEGDTPDPRKTKENQPVFDSTNLRKDWEAATKSAKCPDLLIHDLRRSGVRNLILAGVPETVAMKISGHKTASVFRRYAIVAPSQIQDAMNCGYEGSNTEARPVTVPTCSRGQRDRFE